MIGKTKENLNKGLTRLKWVATFVAERARAETSVARLMYECHKLQSREEDLLKDIGKRVIELSEKGEKDVFGDFVIKQALSEIKDIRETIEDYKKKAKDINKLPE